MGSVSGYLGKGRWARSAPGVEKQNLVSRAQIETSGTSSPSGGSLNSRLDGVGQAASTLHADFVANGNQWEK